MLATYLKLIAITTTFGLVVSFDVFQSLVINPGRDVNFYGEIQSDPIPSEKSAEEAFDNLVQPDCSKVQNVGACNGGPLYHHPGIECQISNPVECDYSDPYRTFDGTCNNPHISRIGQSDQCYGRILPPYYEGFKGFRQSVKGGPLPEPRDISITIFKDHHRPMPNVSFQFATFGEYSMRDLIHSDHKNLDCCGKDASRPECMPISVRPDDPFYSKFNKTCINFRRTYACACQPLKRAPKNIATAHLDDSNLYGINKEQSLGTRALDGTGQLKHNDSSIGSFLPSGSNPKDVFCPKKIQHSCFKGPDPRLNMHAIVLSHENLFMREHNRIAKELKKLNPQWGGEKLYQEARKIHIGAHQCVFYKEFLPILLTPQIMKEFDMDVKPGSAGRPYNSTVLAGIYNEFSIASFRIHSVVSKQTGSFGLPFKDFFSNPDLIRHKGQFTQLFRGLRNTPDEINDRYVVDDLTNYLFKFPGQQYGEDLVSINIQRGRDHGLAPYIESVKFCSEGTVLINSFDDLEKFGLMHSSYVDQLKQLYKDVKDIDMWVGMHLETPLPGGITGPTATCFNAKQFWFIQKGDRFFFDNIGPTVSFSEEQRTELKNCNFARVLCDNTDISKIQKNPFLIPSDDNPEVSCSELPKIDLSLWKES